MAQKKRSLKEQSEIEERSYLSIAGSEDYMLQIAGEWWVTYPSFFEG